MHDVIIVGGGVGGLRLASRLKGMDVLVLEKNRRIVPRDSGIVSGRFLDFYGHGMIKEKIRHMELVSQNESINIRAKKPFAYILKREKFSSDLRKSAGKNADIRFETAVSVEYSKDGARVRTQSGEHACKIVVGCDGSNSVVRRCANIAGPAVSLGIMAITGGMKEKDIRVFFNKHYSPDFFSWIIPANREYGIISSVRPKEYLDFFRRSQHLDGGEIYAYPVPVGFTRSFEQNTILIGDSCGQVKPLTGGGIIFSLLASRHAEKVITDAFAKSRFDRKFLGSYQRLWEKDFGSEIKKQLLFRKVYRLLTNRQIDGIFRDFRRPLEELGSFDYDKFSSAWVKMPKIKMLKHAIGKAKYLGSLRADCGF